MSRPTTRQLSTQTLNFIRITRTPNPLNPKPLNPKPVNPKPLNPESPQVGHLGEKELAAVGLAVSLANVSGYRNRSNSRVVFRA